MYITSLAKACFHLEDVQPVKGCARTALGHKQVWAWECTKQGPMRRVGERTRAMLVADSAALQASTEAAGSMHLMSLSRGKAICRSMREL